MSASEIKIQQSQKNRITLVVKPMLYDLKNIDFNRKPKERKSQ